ncbi:MAG: hypothetical protein HYX74_09605, partial [Acidobacteria bacterium]|nr:hypothetical protein [Acidobacteriota bacterium]
YRYMGRPLFRWVDDWTRDWTSERLILFPNVAAYAVVFVVLVFINMAFDYAKIHTVLQDRKNMLAAASRGVGFVLAHPIRTFGLYGAAGLLGILVVATYAVVAPGANQSTVTTVVAAFLAGQLYLLARIWVKLVFLGSQTALMASFHPAPVPERAPNSEPGPASEAGFTPEPGPASPPVKPVG